MLVGLVRQRGGERERSRESEGEEELSKCHWHKARSAGTNAILARLPHKLHQTLTFCGCVCVCVCLLISDYYVSAISWTHVPAKCVLAGCLINDPYHRLSWALIKVQTVRANVN